MIQVKAGKENLSEINQNEMDLGIEADGEFRLACQCKIEKGNVECEGYI